MTLKTPELTVTKKNLIWWDANLGPPPPPWWGVREPLPAVRGKTGGNTPSPAKLLLSALFCVSYPWRSLLAAFCAPPECKSQAWRLTLSLPALLPPLSLSMSIHTKLDTSEIMLWWYHDAKIWLETVGQQQWWAVVRLCWPSRPGAWLLVAPRQGCPMAWLPPLLAFPSSTPPPVATLRTTHLPSVAFQCPVCNCAMQKFTSGFTYAVISSKIFCLKALL